MNYNVQKAIAGLIREDKVRNIEINVPAGVIEEMVNQARRGTAFDYSSRWELMTATISAIREHIHFVFGEEWGEENKWLLSEETYAVFVKVFIHNFHSITEEDFKNGDVVSLVAKMFGDYSYLKVVAVNLSPFDPYLMQIGVAELLEDIWK